MLVSRTTPLTDSEKLSWLKWALSTHSGDLKAEAAFWKQPTGSTNYSVGKANAFAEAADKIEGILAKLGE